ncbi:ribbon-helix-helix protein, CopG family [Lederbergia sp. NSJ-179]|uniref:ribbon-helix-helix protein, CopG family n=1 Tax=Lederbergia sp. NSJ-179 TaxID=2931402 RepID=UPI001FD5F324|nr:ribbon-helix-helix protein, CopG family [Lederbergia sp. NSJ-179]MCJ7841122.1 ribbon-helix-helix protein, CopG family [Lederbergia sp. NSJ-179]
MKDEIKIRKQIYLEPKQNEQIKLLSARQNKTEAQIIREAINHYLTENKKELDDPILELIGMVKNETCDGSTNHDQDIYLKKNEDTHETR